MFSIFFHLARAPIASPSKPKSAAAVARSPTKAKYRLTAPSSTPGGMIREMLPFDEISKFHSQKLYHHWLMMYLAPIYDGRGDNGTPPFNFSSDHFEHLESLPLFLDESGDRADVPAGAVVAVGYSIGTYSGSKGRSLSPNLIFIIVLSVPA